MQDEMAGRLWVAHHEQFSQRLGGVVDSAAAGVARLFGVVPMPLRAIAAVVAVIIVVAETVARADKEGSRFP